jgi:uncharacterized membrane protein
MNAATKIKSALVFSLALNLFFVAAIGGAVLRWIIVEWMFEEQSGQQHGMRFVTEALPSEQRGAFRNALRAARSESQHDVQAAREGRREVARLLSAPVFNPQDAEAAAARTRAADMAVRSRAESAVISFAATLSAEQRQVLADALIQHGPLHVPASSPAAPTQLSGGAHGGNN